MPLYVLFPFLGKLDCFSEAFYIPLQEQAKYHVSHGYFSGSISTHIPTKSNFFLICNALFQSQNATFDSYLPHLMLYDLGEVT